MNGLDDDRVNPVLDAESLRTSALQSARMDVLVHLLALEQLADVKTVDIDLSDSRQNHAPLSDRGNLPKSPGALELFERAHRVDWVGRSHAFTSADGESSIADRAARAQEGEPLVVRFGSGGQLVGGAMDAALALFYGLPISRKSGSTPTIDRSISALRHSGWSHSDLRALLHKWAVVDPLSAIVLIRLSNEESQQVHHELSCRYDIVHSEYDFLTEIDQIELQLTVAGSVHALFVRAESDALTAAIGRYPEAVAGCFAGDFSTVPLPVLWSPMRQAGTDPEHEQRLRRLRRKEIATQLLDRARGR